LGFGPSNCHMNQLWLIAVRFLFSLPKIHHSRCPTACKWRMENLGDETSTSNSKLDSCSILRRFGLEDCLRRSLSGVVSASRRGRDRSPSRSSVTCASDRRRLSITCNTYSARGELHIQSENQNYRRRTEVTVAQRTPETPLLKSTLPSQELSMTD